MCGGTAFPPCPCQPTNWQLTVAVVPLAQLFGPGGVMDQLFGEDGLLGDGGTAGAAGGPGTPVRGAAADGPRSPVFESLGMDSAEKEAAAAAAAAAAVASNLKDIKSWVEDTVLLSAPHPRRLRPLPTVPGHRTAQCLTRTHALTEIVGAAVFSGEHGEADDGDGHRWAAATAGPRRVLQGVRGRSPKQHPKPVKAAARRPTQWPGCLVH